MAAKKPERRWFAILKEGAISGYSHKNRSIVAAIYEGSEIKAFDLVPVKPKRKAK